MEKELLVMPLNSVTPYERNPRKNDAAVEDVAESIRQCEYLAPILVDEGGVILAGHTRYKALQSLGRTEAEILVCKGLTDEQKRKYRLLDNKVAEASGWDFTLLDAELDGLDFEGYDFGFDIEELDLEGMFAESSGEPKEEKLHEITCPCCGETFSVNSAFEPA